MGISPTSIIFSVVSVLKPIINNLATLLLNYILSCRQLSLKSTFQKVARQEGRE